MGRSGRPESGVSRCERMPSAYLAAALLFALLGNTLAGARWLDTLVGLAIAAVTVREGLETWRGEGCCVTPPLEGAEGNR